MIPRQYEERALTSSDTGHLRGGGRIKIHLEAKVGL